MRKRFLSYCQKIVLGLADTLFPSLCFGCGSDYSFLCSDCERRIPRLATQRCFICQRATTRFGEACYDCAEKIDGSLDAVFAATCYQVPIIKKLIHAYKYRFVKDLSTILGKLLAIRVETSALPLPTLIVPVPLHSKRLRFRGFNQASLLADYLHQNIDAVEHVAVVPALTRVRFTKPQQKASAKEERAQNLHNAFSVTDALWVKGQIIWLVDDVATTNSTLTACAEVLKTAGAKKVYGVVLARD